MRIRSVNCERCHQPLTWEELEHYCGTCEHCETDWMYICAHTTGWRWWIRKVRYWWRRFTAPAFFGPDFFDHR